jgi:integrase/recombinase XerD
MYVRDPLRVVVTGPLAGYAAGFCAELERQGYAPQSASELAQLMAHVSRWLDGQGLMPEELTEEVADRFLADRRGRYRKFRTRRGLRPLLTYLRRIGVVPAVPGGRAWAGGGVGPPLAAGCPGLPGRAAEPAGGWAGPAVGS